MRPRVELHINPKSRLLELGPPSPAHFFQLCKGPSSHPCSALLPVLQGKGSPSLGLFCCSISRTQSTLAGARCCEGVQLTREHSLPSWVSK